MIARACLLLVIVTAVISGVENERVRRFFSSFGYYRRPMRPDYVFPRGYYSNTPPPSYMEGYTQEKVGTNKKPVRNLNDDDVIRLFRNLSKADLDKILEMANDVKTTYQEYKSINNFNNIMQGIGSNTLNVETLLPKPLNLREEYATASSKYTPSVVKPLASYKVENFGELPLTEKANTKLSSVSSYNVPHYSVTSTSIGALSTGPSMIPDIEAAPSPDSKAAHAESDAHLKAIKIWTHKSQGAAYYLHNDGTLSLERPK